MLQQAKVCNAYPGDEQFHVEMGGESIMTGAPLSYKEMCPTKISCKLASQCSVSK